MIRAFRLCDTSINVSAPGSKRERVGRREMTWNAPDYETFNRLLDALVAIGFSVGLDPWIDRHFPSQNRYHRAGARPTPHGDLSFHGEASPIGCKVEFFQDVVTVNSNGGRYDFDKRQKMPYLIRKAFEVALRAVRAHLTSRGFVEDVKLASPVADPLAYFNSRWDGEYERRRGEHRFERGADGWPVAGQLNGNQVSDANPLPAQGSVWYYRDLGGRLARGRVYGGINGMWTVIYGPRPRDFTTKARFELFQCSPAAEPRRVVDKKRGVNRLTSELRRAVEAQDFERAIVVRNSLRKAA